MRAGGLRRIIVVAGLDLPWLALVDLDRCRALASLLTGLEHHSRLPIRVAIDELHRVFERLLAQDRFGQQRIKYCGEGFGATPVPCVRAIAACAVTIDHVIVRKVELVDLHAQGATDDFLRRHHHGEQWEPELGIHCGDVRLDFSGTAKGQRLVAIRRERPAQPRVKRGALRTRARLA